MLKRDDTLKNFSPQGSEEKSASSSVVEVEPIFSEFHVKTLFQSLENKQYRTVLGRNNLILDMIRLKQPISKYGLAQLCNLSYGTIKQVCKMFLMADLIRIDLSVGENGMPVKLVSCKEKEK